MRQVLKGERVLDVDKIVLVDGTEIEVDMKLLAFIPRKVDRDKYVKVYQDHILELVTKKELKKPALAILMWFFAQNDWGNSWIHIDYNKLSRELGMSATSIHRGIRELLRAKLIIQYKPKHTVFRLNPKYVYKGGVVGKR